MSAQSLTKRLSDRTVIRLVSAALSLAFIAFLALLVNAAMKDAAKARAERVAHEAEVKEKLKVVWAGPCPVTGLLGADLVVSCNGKESNIRGDESVRFSYALNPGPLDCQVDGFGSRCKPRPFKPAQ